MLWKFAATFARQIAKTRAAPAEARQSLAQLAFDFLEVFYGLDSEIVSEGLADLLEKAAPYIGGAAASAGGLADLHPRDEDIATWAHRVKEMASLTAQRKMIWSANGYELMRARRLVLFVFGYLRRIAHAAECLNEFEVFGRQLLIVLGRPAVPILVAALRVQTPSGTRLISSLLDFVQMLPRPAELGGADARCRSAHNADPWAHAGQHLVHYRALIPRSRTTAASSEAAVYARTGSLQNPGAANRHRSAAPLALLQVAAAARR